MEDITQTSTTDEAYGAGGNLLLRYTGDSNSRSFVPFNGRLLAEYYCGGMIFDHPDEIGSATTATDCTGNNVQERLYYPYGEFWTGAGSLGMHQVFAQLPDYDPETDQYNTLARHYSPSGRWMSPDWSAKAEPVPYAKLDNPQSLNLYSYALNNPLRNVDRDGHCDSSANATANTKCQDVKNLHVNDAMKQKMKDMEGDPNHKGDPLLKVYKDTAGNPTVGWGHMDPGLKVGDTITKEEAQAYFDKDISDMESKVADVLTSNGGHQFSQGEFNALTDLSFNVGPGVFTTDKSPSLMKDMEAGDYGGMSGQLRYTKDSAGNPQKGLETRSDERKSIFLGGDP